MLHSRALKTFRTQHPKLTRILALSLVFFTVTRLILFFSSWSSMGFFEKIGALGVGFYFDLVLMAVILSPFAILGLITPISRITPYINARPIRWFWLSVYTFLLAFVCVSEVVFWFEFHTRMNFIAVDYLLYTHEVIGNIKQSYPMPLIFSGIGLGAIIISFFLTRKPLHVQPQTNRLKQILAFATVLVVSYVGANIDLMDWSKNAVSNEISGNGLVTFFAAVRRNDLDYLKFYATQDQKQNDETLKKLGIDRPMLSEFQPTKGTETPKSFGRLHLKRKPKNVVMISVESLSGSLVGPRGTLPSLTPRLDALAKESLVFDHFFATGTRTVRGLEALSLGIPPIPGQSVVRRPNNDNLTTVGNILKDHGIDPFFVYGGYGYFDNMNAYFDANHYQVIDRNNFPKETIPFENIWGVADEALYTNAMTNFDRVHADSHAFFAHIMTTSNHRPFTYPDGRIDIPSPGGREGAVKYTDYTIGDFIDRAKKRPWFNDTLFIITADHCASVAGKTKLPVDQYRIPLLIYGPGIIEPGVRHDLVSQIDIPPTILDALKVPGEEYFFGESLFSEESKRPARAFLSNYQTLGYYKNDILTVLMPQRKIEAYRVNPQTYVSTPIPVDPVLLNETIAFYQTAAVAFKKGALKDQRPRVAQNHSH